MINVSNGESAVSLFDTLGINEKAVESAIAIINPQYQRAKLDLIIDSMLNGTITKVDNRLFTVYRQANDYAKATIQTRTSLGGNLKLTFTNTEFNLIARGNAVYADNGTMGKVVAKGDGYVVISFVSALSGATAFVAADFAANESCIDGGDIGDTTLRVEKDTIFTAPDPFQNVIQQMSASAQILFDEMHTKTYLPAANGKQYYYYQKEADALQRLHRQYNKRMYQNTPAVFSGASPISASPINQVMTMGGTPIALGAAESYTASQFRNWFRQYSSVGGFSTGEIVGIVGPQFLANFQEAFEDSNVKYVGINNTVGGKEVKGINFMEYAFMSFNLKLIVEPMLADTQMFPTAANGYSTRSNSALFMNSAPVPTKNMGPLPFATSRYFGPTADVMHTVRNGIIDQNGNIAPVGTSSGPQAAITHEFFWNKMNQLSNPANSMYIGS